MAGWGSLRLAAKIGVSGRQGLITAPLVTDDSIYAAEPYDCEVIKLSRLSLRELWRIRSNKGRPSGLYGKSLLLDGAETSSAELGTTAIDAGTGKQLWTRRARFGTLNWRGRPILKHENEPFEIVDPATGETLETLDVPHASPMALCDDLLLFRTSYNDPVRAYGLTDRREVWAEDLLAEIRAKHDVKDPKPLINCVPGGEGVFVGTCGEWTFGASLEDGRLLWGAPVLVPYYWPNVHAGRVYVLLFNRLVAIDEARGEILYDVTHPDIREVAYRARPGTIYGGTIAFANESGLLAVFNLWNGSLLWSYVHKAPLWGTAEADGRLLVSTGDGKLLVFAEKS